MKAYLTDTNFWLRFLLADDEVLSNKARMIIEKSRREKRSLILLGEVIMEMVYVLDKVYGYSRVEISKTMFALMGGVEVNVRDGKVWEMVFRNYVDLKLDLVDIFLVKKAKEEGYVLATFDKKMMGLMGEKN